MAEPSWREIGVLTRDNSHAADVFDALTRREIPVEIVGLKGLLRLPEVAEVVATLTLVQDVTANASLLTLLAGPRWAIGTRDLALLGRRAADLVRAVAAAGRTTTSEPSSTPPSPGSTRPRSPRSATPWSRPGELDYSPEAGTASRCSPPSCGGSGRRVGEPILDLVRRIIDTCGIDVELASSASPAASARRDNLDLFVQAVSEFQAVDGQVTLAALLAWLEAEDDLRPGSRRGHPLRGRLRQAADGAPGQGPGVGRRVHPRCHRAEVPHRPVPLDLADRAVRDARAASVATPATARAGGAHAGRHRRLHARPPRSTSGSRSSGSAYVAVDPRATPAPGHRLVLLARRSRPAAAPRTYLEATVRALAARVARCRRRGATGPARTSPTPTPPSTPTCRGRCRTRRRGRATARRGGPRRRGAEALAAGTRGPTRPTTCSCSAGSRSGTTS